MTGSSDGVAVVWQLRGRGRISLQHDVAVDKCRFSKDSSVLVVLTSTFEELEALRLSPVTFPSHLFTLIYSSHFSPERYLVLWNPHTGEQLAHVRGHHTHALPVPQHSYLLACTDSSITAFEYRKEGSLRNPRIVKGHSAPIIYVNAFDRNVRVTPLVVTVSSDGHVFLWNAQNWQSVRSFQTAQSLKGSCVTPDESMVSE